MKAFRIYRDSSDLLIEQDGTIRRSKNAGIDEMLAADIPLEWVKARFDAGVAETDDCLNEALHAPMGSQEVWAAGVTYQRSRTARMEESKESGGGSFYDHVYNEKRPELFFKGNALRTVGSGGVLLLRGDSEWQVPEPELTLVISRSGDIVGYTIGNDLSSRDIEGKNPLYLPQAKVWKGSTGLGPCIYMSAKPLSPDTAINLQIYRNDEEVFAGDTQLSQMKQTLENLVEYMGRYQEFPAGLFLMTGTGIVPPDHFTLQEDDVVVISIEPIGVLKNRVMNFPGNSD